MALTTGNVFMDIFAVLVALLAVALAYFKWSFGYWRRRGVSTLPTIFLFGNAIDLFLQRTSFGESFKGVYHEMKTKGLAYCGFYFFARPTLVVRDPELVKTLMTKDFAHFTDHGNYVNEKVDPLSGHLFDLKGLKWKNLRTKLTPTFTSGKMKMMFPTLVACSDELGNVVDGTIKLGEALDIKEVVARFATDVIGSCAFGIECNSLKNPESEFRHYGKKFTEESPTKAIKNLLSIIFPKVLDFFQIPFTDRGVTKFFMNVVENTVSYRERNNVTRKDFMHLLIQLKNNVKIKDEEKLGQLKNVGETQDSSNASQIGTTLTLEELAAQAFVFFIAGFETSSTTLTFCFYELVSNPPIQVKLRDEIASVLANSDGKITYNAIMEMTYMDKCIHETLRKYPSVPVLTRECTQKYKIPRSNITVEKGMQVFVPIWDIQRDPEHYPDPEKFDPERFSPENKAQRHPYTWLPFGEGPRSCIGLRFAMMQIKVALTVLLMNYKFTLNSKTQVPLVMDPKSFMLNAIGGIWLNAEKV